MLRAFEAQDRILSEYRSLTREERLHALVQSARAPPVSSDSVHQFLTEEGNPPAESPGTDSLIFLDPGLSTDLTGIEEVD